MNKVISFTKLRFLFLTVSLIAIAAGIAGTISRGGFDLGIDFNAGLSQRVQIAPLGFSISYEGEESPVVNVINDGITVETRTETGVVRNRISFEEYTTLRAVASAVSEIPGVSIELKVEGLTPSSRIISLNHPVNLVEGPALVNILPENAGISLDEMRTVLSNKFGDVQVQTVGRTENQEFMIQVEDPGDDKDFAVNAEDGIVAALSASYGAEQVLVRQSDFVGPKFSANLGQQSFLLTLLALGLILVYVWIRFKLAYAVSAISALFHDVLIMLGFIGTFQMEVSTATIAAVLTIIGYSLNDTIVIFDRVRENTGLMSDSRFRDVIDTSITQSLSRTLITSLTTLLAAVSLYVFGSGSIKDFALALIVGVVVGTYSSIFVASPILLGWTNATNARRKKKDAQKYGVKKEAKIEGPVTEETPKKIEIPKVERRLKGKRKKK